MTDPTPPIFGKNFLKDRSAVQRRHAPTYLLIMLLSFAFSVTATRIFLNLTRFPQLGSGQLHIAHVLWGGLILFVASVIPLILVNQWALQISSLLAGIGVGLFIDEVGKFITRTNDYFFPSAAPIIYAFFLLTVLIFVQVKHQRKQSPRAKMYAILEDFAEVLDRDLSQFEYIRLNAQLNDIIDNSDEDQLVTLAHSLQDYLEKQKSRVVPHDPILLEKIQLTWDRFESRWLTRNKMRAILVVGLFLWAGWALSSQTVMYLATHNTQQLTALIQQFTTNRLIRNSSGMNWFEAQILLEGSMGIIALISVLFFLFKQEKIAVWIGILDLIATLVAVNLITFYFDQFSTIAFAIFEFVLLVLLLLYRRRFLSPQPVKHHQNRKRD
jgi:hypothetical protein